MSAFDKIIGYESIKEELIQICDSMRYKEIYEQMGAKTSHGLLLYGKPGLGKTLMAKCLIEESGRDAYMIRRNKGDDFINYIAETFKKAKEKAPSIIFLDDIDKFANGDRNHRNAPEYVTVQAGIDEVKDSEVFVIATVNEIGSLPKSLTRSGRFDRVICIEEPTGEDADKIVKHFMKGKKIAEGVNLDDFTKMIKYHSCAQLETIINESAVRAAFARREKIEMRDLVESTLEINGKYSKKFKNISAEKIRKNALHEAGHLVVAEVLNSESVGVAVLKNDGGYIRCHKGPKNSYHDVVISLAGKAAVELYYSENFEDKSYKDLQRAIDIIRNKVADEGMNGIGNLEIFGLCEMRNISNEAVIHAELERYLNKARYILQQNREFLEKVAEALAEKKILFYSDIKAIRESVSITKIYV